MSVLLVICNILYFVHGEILYLSLLEEQLQWDTAYTKCADEGTTLLSLADTDLITECQFAMESITGSRAWIDEKSETEAYYVSGNDGSVQVLSKASTQNIQGVCCHSRSTALQCGDTITGTIANTDNYILKKVTITSPQDIILFQSSRSDFEFVLSFLDTDSNIIAYSDSNTDLQIQGDVCDVIYPGNYALKVQGDGSNVGNYNIAITCTVEERKDGICLIPQKRYEDCRSMTRDSDRDSFGEMLGTEGNTQCMKITANDYYNWVKNEEQLQFLCTGCFDPFCDRNFLKNICLDQYQAETAKFGVQYIDNGVADENKDGIRSTFWFIFLLGLIFTNTGLVFVTRYYTIENSAKKAKKTQKYEKVDQKDIDVVSP